MSHSGLAIASACSRVSSIACTSRACFCAWATSDSSSRPRTTVPHGHLMIYVMAPPADRPVCVRYSLTPLARR